jgi:DNA recombination protein RmuC
MSVQLDGARSDLKKERDAHAQLEAQQEQSLRTIVELNEAKVRLESEVEGSRAQRELLETHLKQVGARVVEEGGAAFQAKLNDDVLRPVREDLQRISQGLLEAKHEHSDEVKAFASLALALRGSSKAQGVWGEVVLERVLEAAGLKEPVHFQTQVSLPSRDGDPANRPDVIVHLPGERDVIVDSKISLTSFVRAQEAADGERLALLKEHARALRNHVDELAGRQYPDRLKTALDYVLMFVPNENALFAAYEIDPELYDYAARSRIWLCSQTTLLPLLHVVDMSWRAEKANEAAREICRQAGKMVEKLQGAAEEFGKVRASIRRADEQLADCHSKLFEGRGNVLTAAGRVVDLGAEVSADKKAKLRALAPASELPELPEGADTEAA